MMLLTLGATAPVMEPRRPRTDPRMKNHLRPKISESLPTMRKNTAPPQMLTKGTQLMFGDGPMSALILPRMGATRPNPGETISEVINLRDGSTYLQYHP